MKYLKRFDENENNEGLDKKEYNFFKTEFIAEEKAIVGAYYIVKKGEKSIEVLNLKESPNHNATYMDNSTPYTIKSVNKCILPLSQITIIGPVDDREGFFFIKIPYWLFKKDDGLSIYRYDKKKRFDGGRTIEGLISNVTKEYKKEYLTKMLDPNVEKYLKASNKDELFDNSFKNFIRSANHWMDK